MYHLLIETETLIIIILGRKKVLNKRATSMWTKEIINSKQADFTMSRKLGGKLLRLFGVVYGSI